MSKPSFEAFRETGIVTTNIGADVGDVSLSGVPGIVYSGYWIERTGGQWHTQLDREEVYSPVLDDVERALYAYAISAGLGS